LAIVVASVQAVVVHSFEALHEGVTGVSAEPTV
jgi:hypothetical protein